MCLGNNAFLKLVVPLLKFFFHILFYTIFDFGNKNIANSRILLFNFTTGSQAPTSLNSFHFYQHTIWEKLIC